MCRAKYAIKAKVSKIDFSTLEKWGEINGIDFNEALYDYCETHDALVKRFKP